MRAVRVPFSWMPDNCTRAWRNNRLITATSVCWAENKQPSVRRASGVQTLFPDSLPWSRLQKGYKRSLFPINIGHPFVDSTGQTTYSAVSLSIICRCWCNLRRKKTWSRFPVKPFGSRIWIHLIYCRLLRNFFLKKTIPPISNCSHKKALTGGWIFSCPA